MPSLAELAAVLLVGLVMFATVLGLFLLLSWGLG